MPKILIFVLSLIMLSCTQPSSLDDHWTERIPAGGEVAAYVTKDNRCTVVLSERASIAGVYSDGTVKLDEFGGVLSQDTCQQVLIDGWRMRIQKERCNGVTLHPTKEELAKQDLFQEFCVPYLKELPLHITSKFAPFYEIK